MNHINKVRLLFWCSLIFSFGVISCRDKEKADEEIILGWQDKQVRKILIPRQWLSDFNAKFIRRDLQVVLPGPGSPSILGNYSVLDEFVQFEPSIPFTRGLKYEIIYRDRKLKEIVIPAPEGKHSPMVTAIYPREDSLPENLLKIYIGFSEQMREGVSAHQVVLVKDGVDTLSNVFLDLQPELWNHDRTMLTLWLNPGRIKRDLIPNREEGPPLVPGARYEILVKPGWQDVTGDTIATAFEKKFVTIIRDTIMPNTADWTVEAPKAETMEPVILHFNEPLDYLVLKNALFVLNEDSKEQPGTVEIGDNERTWRFVPYRKWKKGSYQIRIQPRVEDLAGNNLERLFDNDLAKATAQKQELVFQSAFVKEFEIR
jgi:hypothetical protein